jgi:hypothetical protein
MTKRAFSSTMTSTTGGNLCPKVALFNRCAMVGTSNIMSVTVGHKLPSVVDVIVEENARFVIITCVVCPEVAVDQNCSLIEIY